MLKCVARASAIRLPMMLADVIAADPIANWRRVSMVLSLLCMIGHFVHSQHLRVSSEVNQSIPGHNLHASLGRLEDL